MIGWPPLIKYQFSPFLRQSQSAIPAQFKAATIGLLIGSSAYVFTAKLALNG